MEQTSVVGIMFVLDLGVANPKVDGKKRWEEKAVHIKMGRNLLDPIPQHRSYLSPAVGGVRLRS